MRVAAFLAQHPQRVNHEIRVAGEILVDLHLVAERDHRRFSRIRRQQLRKQNAAAAQLIDHGSGIRTGLHRDHQGDRIRHPIHLYRLRHIVVVENQVFRRQPVHVMSFGIGDGGGRDYQRNGAFELRPAGASKHDDSGGNTHREKRSSSWANPGRPLGSHLERGLRLNCLREVRNILQGFCPRPKDVGEFLRFRGPFGAAFQDKRMLPQVKQCIRSGNPKLG